MKIDKNELSRKITQIKGIVPKTTTIEALQGVLLKDGYLIASNTEVTVKAKLESAEGTPFIIPAKVFDLIGSLPSGELTMECKDDTVSLQVGKIWQSSSHMTDRASPGKMLLRFRRPHC